MISEIGIKNFKCIKDSGLLEIKPITLIFGPNNSGKSSILQNFLLLKQTFESSDPNVPLIINGDYIQLGSFQDFINKHDVKSKYELQLGISVDLTFYPRELAAPVKCLVNLTFAYLTKSRRVYIQKYSICNENGGVIVEWDLNKDGKVLNVKTDTLQNFEQMKSRFKKISFDHFPYILYPGPSGKEGDANYVDLRLVRRLHSTLRNILRDKLFYIGPLRKKTERSYIASGEMPHDVGFGGEKTSEIIYMDKRMSPKKRRDVLGKVKKWLEHFGFFSDIRLKSYPGSSFYSMMATDANSGVEVNLADVGFGISQVLPTIAQGYFAPKNSTILMEQPEIHLHPRIQADFADMLVDIVATNECQVIVETHSEHILLRLRRRIAEGTVNAADVAVYYVESQRGESKSSHITPIPLASDGSMERWPEDFFSSDVEDAFKMAEGLSRNHKSKANLK